MKNLFISILFLFSVQVFAITPMEISNLVISLSNFSEKEKLTDSDLPEITQQLKNIIILEKIDDSHEGPFELSGSYVRNKVIYQKAIRSFSKDDQKRLQSILKIVEDIGKNGNG